MTSRWPPEPAHGSPGGVAAVPPALSPAPPVALGAMVADKYRVDDVIGFGGMGIVCAGTHVELGTPIAIKFVRPEKGADERAVARFLTEARAAAQLKSQFACRVMDCGRLPSGTPYIVMEHLQGSDLRTLVEQKGPLPVEDAVSFALQACEALAEAHAKHIVHRDVKPENLFLTEGPDGAPLLKVLDFGISKQVGPLGASRSLTEPTENMGSPFHMSPEQMIDPTSVDSRTDIWSLGVVLYEVLTGQLPFSGETTPQLCANVMTTQPIPPQAHREDIPDGLSRVILRCLEKDRERRYADVAELGLALKEFGGAASSLAAARVERILGKTPSPARSEPSPEPEPESEGEHAALSGGGAIAIAGLPRRGSGWRAAAVVVLLAASALAAVAARSVWWPAEAEPLPSVSVTVLPPTPPSASALPDGSASPAPSAPAKPRPRPARSAVAPSAPVATAAPRVPLVPTPVLSSSPPSLYPELRPPELPPPSAPSPE